MTSDKAPKPGSGKTRKTVKIAEKPTKDKTAKQYRLPAKPAVAETRKSQQKRAGSGQGVRTGKRASPQGGEVKAGPPGNVRQLRPRKPVHDGWGPFYNLAGAAELLGVPPADAEKQGEARDLLMVSTDDGGLLFPVWQFTGRHLHSRVAKALAVFRDLQGSPWLVVQWATAPNPQLGGATPVEWLRGNHPLEPVLEDARTYAARWSR